ncbi:MAG TPA: thiamine phosphate synthase [Kofleriaceae bacterium]|nr:thiamine phosphate synthase [Kofleriaceae bacterium]
MSVRVVVITDRRLYGSEELAAHVARILRAVPRGSVAVQVREKDLDGGPLATLAREVLEVTKPAGAPLWINDRLDVAYAIGATGVHLPERGLAIDDALTACAAANMSDDSFADEESVELDVRGALSKREGLAIGCSRHTAEAVCEAAANGASLVQLGPIFATPNKGAPLGAEVLAVRTQLPDHVSLVAVGGIDSADRAREAAYAGADAVAVIRAAWTADSPHLIAELVDAVEAGIGMRMLSRTITPR